MTPARATGFDELVRAARALVADGRRAVLGIAGEPGAGKSTLAEALLAALAPTPPAGRPAGGWVAHVPMDGFHLADVELERLGLRDVKGAPATFDVHGYVNTLRRLHADDEPVVYAPAFERELEQPLAGAVPVASEARLVITEGNYLLLDEGPWAAVRPLLDLAWFCAPDDAERLTRLVARHVRFGKSPQAAHDWAHGTDEHNARVIRATAGRADVVVGPDVLDNLPPS